MHFAFAIRTVMADKKSTFLQTRVKIALSSIFLQSTQAAWKRRAVRELWSYSTSTMSRIVKATIVIGLVVSALIALAVLLPAKELAIELIDWVRGLGALGPAVFFLAYLTASILGFSRTALNIVAGTLFDPVIAVATVVGAAVVAFLSTYSIARYFAADWVAARLKRYRVAKNLMSAVEANGFRLLILMRMNPFVPGFVNGYGFGLTSIRLIPYLVASVIGALPLILINVYLGWAGGEAMLRSDGQPSAVQSGTLAFGVVLSLVLLVAIGWYGKRVLQTSSEASASLG